MTLSLASLAALALVALAVVAALATIVGYQWARARGDAALREVQALHRHLGEITDQVWFETDADGTLTRWAPPAVLPQAWTAAPAAGTRFEELLEAGQREAWRTRVQAGVPVDAEALPLRLDDAWQPWAVHARARRAPDGALLGYVGSARPVGAALQADFAAGALAGLLPLLDGSALLFRRDAVPASWRLVQASPATAPALLAPGADGTPVDWDAALARLPPELAQAVSAAPPGALRQAGEWQLAWNWTTVGTDAQGGRLLVWRKAAAEPAEAAPDAGDQESFVYSVSHDLRAPIRVVEGFARILKEDYGRFLDRIGNDHTDRILAAAARMNSMIDALLALSRLQTQPLKRQPVDLSQLARYIVDDLRAGEPERAADIEIEPGLMIQGDPTLLRIAIENLVGNAWKYSGQCVRTRIELRREPGAASPTYVIADHGAGFDMRFADRLFGVFQRLHSAKDFQGTGVGLASVRRIIRRHGGDIWAEAEVGKGARFYFTLP